MGGSGLLRISGGSLGGRTIQVPPGIIRPAMDRMRESIFAVLGDLSGASFLDLFSGSGIIALEAASRGASYIEAVESDPLKRKTLISNTSISPVRIHCRFMAVELYVRRSRRSFDIIFCDPPFSYKYKRELLSAIGASPCMTRSSKFLTEFSTTGSSIMGASVESSIGSSPGSSLLLIHRPKTEQTDWSGKGLALRETRLYGNSAVDFFVPERKA